jgi:uncharacterized protein YcfJ
MLKNVILATAMVGVLAPMAMAWEHDGRHELQKYIIVPVTRHETNYTYSERKEPFQKCYDIEVRDGRGDYDGRYEAPREHYKEADKNSVGVDTLIGAVAGVAIGNQIGHGNGKDVAKVVGGVGGALIANNLREGEVVREPSRNYSNHSQTKIVQKCETEYRIVKDNKIDGYKNYFYLDNKMYYKISDRKLRDIEINVKYNW